MAKTRKQLAKARAAKAFTEDYAKHTDEQLNAMFDNIGSLPQYRVKKTGHIKLRWIKFGDQILAELRRRRTERDEAALEDFNYVGSRHHY